MASNTKPQLTPLAVDENAVVSTKVTDLANGKVVVRMDVLGSHTISHFVNSLLKQTGHKDESGAVLTDQVDDEGKPTADPAPIADSTKLADLDLSKPLALVLSSAAFSVVLKGSAPFSNQGFQGPSSFATPRVGGGGAAQKPAVDQTELKKQAGYLAVEEFVKSGMVIGLGTGSTAHFVTERVGQLMKEGTLKDIVAIPTSIKTAEEATGWGIPLSTLDEHSKLDVAIDGADEIDANYNMVKGRGGALLREKMVEIAAEKFVVVVDGSKLVDRLGLSGAMPVEITPFCYQHTMRQLSQLPSMPPHAVRVRRGKVQNAEVDGDEIAVTDNGNYIADFFVESPIEDPVSLANEILNVVGVVEHGLFIGMSEDRVVAAEGGARVEKK